MSFAIAEHALGYAVATCGFLIVAEGAGYLTRGSLGVGHRSGWIGAKTLAPPSNIFFFAKKVDLRR